MTSASDLPGLLLAGLAFWLIRTPYPFAGEPIVTMRIPPVVEEIKTASIDQAPETKADSDKPSEAEEPAEDEGERRKVEILEATPQETVETEAAIIVSPRRSLKPAPFAEVSETGPDGPLPRIGPGNRKPQTAYARTVSTGVLYSSMPKVVILLGGMGLNRELTQEGDARSSRRGDFRLRPLWR